MVSFFKVFIVFVSVFSPNHVVSIVRSAAEEWIHKYTKVANFFGWAVPCCSLVNPQLMSIGKRNQFHARKPNNNAVSLWCSPDRIALNGKAKPTFSCVIFNSDFTGQCNKVIFLPIFVLFFVAALDFRDNSHNAFIFSQHSAVNVLDRAYSNRIIYLHESRGSAVGCGVVWGGGY